MQRTGRTGIAQRKEESLKTTKKNFLLSQINTPKAICTKKQCVARTELKQGGSQTWNKKSVSFFHVHFLIDAISARKS